MKVWEKACIKAKWVPFANGVMLALGLMGSRLWVKVTSVPKKILLPTILVALGIVLGKLAEENFRRVEEEHRCVVLPEVG